MGTREKTMKNSQIVIKKVIGAVVYCLVCILVIVPIVLMFINSFKSNDEMLRNLSGLPKKWTISSYVSIFTTYSSLIRHFFNSIIISIVSTVLGTFFCTLGAYSFAKYRFKGKRILFAILLATMMIPMEVVMPGQYMLFSRLKMINTLMVQILPTVPAVIGIYMIRQYLVGIPDSLMESARIDGAGHMRTFTSIVIPVASPIVSAYAILHFLNVWTDYTWPLLVATKSSVMPIMVSLPTLVDSVVGFIPVWGTIMAGSVLCSLPLIFVFILNQDKLMSSVVLGAVKG